ncbi:class I SAM-dependent methyltransferase [Streptomyces sp. NPDC001621]|uniref:class I SAM-dependent methyltransferase n=1 Tax=Streptomyces sp. NPDC001621 TaxID=3364594 RepID=UPI003679FB62
MVDAGKNLPQRWVPSAARRCQSVPAIQPYYAQNAGRLGQRYGSVPFEEVHGGVVDLLPPAPAVAVDIGSGTGRDAAALAQRGYQVVAVEPVPELREVAQRLYQSAGVRWVEDCLPELSRLNEAFDVALLSAVWMHLPPAVRRAAMDRLAALLAPSGLLIISLRRGAPPTDRVMFDVPADEVLRDGERAGLRLVRLVEEGADCLGRAEVWWQTVALRKGGE